jgi:hypothetical protein
MTKLDWKSIAEIVGVTAIVASLIFVGLQVRQEDDIARLELIDRSTDQQRDLHVWMTENADVWIRGCAGSELGEADQFIFQSIVRHYASQTYNRWVRYTITSQTGSNGQFLIDAEAANIHRYPGFRAAFYAMRVWSAEGRRYEDSYFQEFRRRLDSRLAELTEIDPNPDWDLKHCGA